MAEERRIDVREIPKPERHPLIIAAFDELEVGTGLILISDHEPQHLRTEMENEFAEALGWEALDSDGEDFRVRISRCAGTAIPRVVLDVDDLAPTTDDQGTEISGSVWQLSPQRRDLDANVISLAPGGEIREHTGPGLDVLIHVLDGGGVIETELSSIQLRPGQIVWLPRRSRRRFKADDATGLRYFSVHQRKQGLSISSRP